MDTPSAIPGLFSFATLLAACACSAPAEYCANGADDDDDGFVDCADQDCTDDAACGESSCDDSVDDDGDGLVDCDDPDCDCTPAACEAPCLEDCSNGVDDDKDFLVDCVDPDCASVCDADGDGHMVPLDCDDNDAGVHPDAEEVPYDGADNDCDPSTPDDDLDQDGYALADDCDDALASSYPGAPEVCGNGVVDDCTSNETPPLESCYGVRGLDTADVRFVSATPEGWLGCSVATLGDPDGDGTTEVVLGMYGSDTQSGAVVVVEVPAQGLVDVATARTQINAASELDWLGESVSVIRREDGVVHDILTGARHDDGTGNNAGAVYLISSNVDGTVTTTSAFTTLTAGHAGDHFGALVLGGGDINGDGIEDAIFGAPSAGRDQSGMGYVQYGPLPEGEARISDADVIVDSALDGANFGRVAAAGDVDGDGLNDVVFGARYAAIDGVEAAGGAYLFTGLTGTASYDETDASAHLAGTEAFGELGAAVALANLDGDPLAELVAGVPGASEGAGEVWIASGATLGALTPQIVLLGPPGSSFGASLAAGDINGDGRTDLVVGAPAADLVDMEDAGAVYVYFGPVTEGQPADIVIEGTRPYGFAGYAIEVSSDWTGDGRDELLIGAPFVDSGGSASGAVGVITWGF